MPPTNTPQPTNPTPPTQQAPIAQPVAPIQQAAPLAPQKSTSLAKALYMFLSVIIVLLLYIAYISTQNKQIEGSGLPTEFPQSDITLNDTTTIQNQTPTQQSAIQTVLPTPPDDSPAPEQGPITTNLSPTLVLAKFTPTADDALDSHFQSMLDQAENSPANFASNYAIVMLGCGSGCVAGYYLYNKIDNNLYSFPEEVLSDIASEPGSEDIGVPWIEFSANSNVLKAHKQNQLGIAYIENWILENNTFKLQ